MRLPMPKTEPPAEAHPYSVSTERTLLGVHMDLALRIMPRACLHRANGLGHRTVADTAKSTLDSYWETAPPAPSRREVPRSHGVHGRPRPRLAAHCPGLHGVL